MNFVELRRELRAFAEKSIVDRLNPTEFKRKAKLIADKYLAPNEYKKSILNDICKEFDYSNANALLKEEQKVVSELFTSLNPDFAKQKIGLRNDIVQVVKQGLDNGEFSKQLQGRVEDIIGKYRGYANTITRTALSGFDTLSQYKDDDENTVYEYVGTAPQRQFCKSMLGKQMTRKEINELSKRIGYDVFIMKGGFNCRHGWTKVIK